MSRLPDAPVRDRLFIVASGLALVVGGLLFLVTLRVEWAAGDEPKLALLLLLAAFASTGGAVCGLLAARRNGPVALLFATANGGVAGYCLYVLQRIM